MPLMLPVEGLLDPVDDTSGVELPPRFADANAKAMQPAAWRKLKDPFPIWKWAEPS